MLAQSKFWQKMKSWWVKVSSQNIVQVFLNFGDLCSYVGGLWPATMQTWVYSGSTICTKINWGITWVDQLLSSCSWNQDLLFQGVWMSCSYLHKTALQLHNVPALSNLQDCLPVIHCHLSVACLLKVYVLVYEKLTTNEYLWTKAKFLNRQSYMQDMYGTFEHTGKVPRVPQVTGRWHLSYS